MPVPPFFPPSGEEALVYQKAEWAFVRLIADEGEHLHAFKFDRPSRSWNEVEIDWLRIATPDELALCSNPCDERPLVLLPGGSEGSTMDS